MDKDRITENISEFHYSIVLRILECPCWKSGLFPKSRSEHCPGLSERKAELHIGKESRHHQGQRVSIA
jgi:hypothetical protein